MTGSQTRSRRGVREAHRALRDLRHALCLYVHVELWWRCSYGAAGMAALPRLKIFGVACRAASRAAITYIPGRIHFVTWPITPSGAVYIAQARHDPREVPVVLTECHAYKDPKA